MHVLQQVIEALIPLLLIFACASGVTSSAGYHSVLLAGVGDVPSHEFSTDPTLTIAPYRYTHGHQDLFS
jgi:hypothetical protein